MKITSHLRVFIARSYHGGLQLPPGIRTSGESKMNSSQARRTIAAGMIGNVLEWYDFAIYGYFATAIGRHFFPHEDAVAQLLLAFGVFALGYLMRPVGGVVVGHIGDRFGRRAALTTIGAARTARPRRDDRALWRRAAHHHG